MIEPPTKLPPPSFPWIVLSCHPKRKVPWALVLATGTREMAQEQAGTFLEWVLTRPDVLEARGLEAEGFAVAVRHRDSFPPGVLEEIVHEDPEGES